MPRTLVFHGLLFDGKLQQLGERGEERRVMIQRGNSGRLQIVRRGWVLSGWIELGVFS